MDFGSVTEGFDVFSKLWSPGSWGPFWGQAFWLLNAMACLIIAVEGFAMLHLSHWRLARLAYGLVSLGGFTYAIGELGGLYWVVAPVETLFHWAIVAGLTTSLLRRAQEKKRNAQNSLGAQVGARFGQATGQYTGGAAERR